MTLRSGLVVRSNSNLSQLEEGVDKSSESSHDKSIEEEVEDGNEGNVGDKNKDIRDEIARESNVSTMGGEAEVNPTIKGNGENNEFRNMMQLILSKMEQNKKEVETGMNEIKNEVKQTKKEIKSEIEQTNAGMNEMKEELSRELKEFKKDTNQRLDGHNKQLKELFEMNDDFNKRLDKQKGKSEQDRKAVDQQFVEQRSELIELIGKENTKNKEEIKKQVSSISGKVENHEEEIREIKDQVRKNSDTGENNNRILNEKFTIVEENQVEIRTLKEKQASLLSEMERREKDVNNRIARSEVQVRQEIKNKQGNLERQCHGGVHAKEIELPKFNGKQTNPLEFLKVVEKRFEKRLEEGWLEWEEVLEMISQAFVGETRSWFSVYRDSMSSLKEFKRKFTDKYWSEEIQGRERERLAFGKYQLHEGATMTEYFLAHVMICQNLDGITMDADVVRLLLRHFPERVREAACMQRVKTIQEMEELLGSFDALGTKNQRMENTRNYGHHYKEQRNFRGQQNYENKNQYHDRQSGRNNTREQREGNSQRAERPVPNETSSNSRREHLN